MTCINRTLGNQRLKIYCFLFCSGNVYRFTWVRLGCRLAMHAGNCIVWNTASSPMAPFKTRFPSRMACLTDIRTAPLQPTTTPLTRSSVKPALVNTCLVLSLWIWNPQLSVRTEVYGLLSVLNNGKKNMFYQHWYQLK